MVQRRWLTLTTLISVTAVVADTTISVCLSPTYTARISLYEHCLRLKPKHNYATYNLPATIARLELADSVAVQAIREYEQRTSFYLPDYQEDLPELWELHHDMLDAEEEDFEEDDSFELDDVTEEEFDESVEPDEVHWQSLFDYILNDTKEDLSLRQKLLLKWAVALAFN